MEDELFTLIDPKTGVLQYNGTKPFNGEIRFEGDKLIIITYGSNLTIDDVEIRIS